MCLCDGGDLVKQLGGGRSGAGIQGEHGVDQWVEGLVSRVCARNPIVAIDNRQFVGVFKRMFVEANCIEDKPRSPDINCLVDRKVGPGVEHLRCSVHWGAVLGQLILQDSPLIHVPIRSRGMH